VSDVVQRLLDEVGFKEVHSSSASGERQLSMPVSVLEALAEKVSLGLCRRAIDDVDKSLRSFRKPPE
jgi:hypothetical protein